MYLESWQADSGSYWAQQRPKVVRDIVLACVVLHNMLGTHKGDQTGFLSK